MSVMPIDMEVESEMDGARIKVIGVGGGGNNAVDRMIESGLKKADFICVNTDAQQLSAVLAPTVLQLGKKLTNGLGAGANPEVGKQAAEESKDEIKNLLKDTEMVFLTAGMGGGTGTGAAPIIAEISKSLGILTVAVITKPFSFEGPKRMKNAEEGIKQLVDKVDAIVTIPNDLLLKTADKKITLNDSFKLADDVLRQGVQGIIEIITMKGIVNCDFADVRTIMKDSGIAHMGIGIGKGENAAQDAVRAAIESPLLETSISGAENVLLYIIGGSDFSLVDMGEVSTIVHDMVSEDANIIVGSGIDDELKDEIKVTLVATGLDASARRQKAAEQSGEGILNRTKRHQEQQTSATASSYEYTPSDSTNDYSYSDDSIFSRKLKPGMDNINVPSFFKPKN